MHPFPLLLSLDAISGCRMGTVSLASLDLMLTSFEGYAIYKQLQKMTVQVSHPTIPYAQFVHRTSTIHLASLMYDLTRLIF